MIASFWFEVGPSSYRCVMHCLDTIVLLRTRSRVVNSSFGCILVLRQRRSRSVCLRMGVYASIFMSCRRLLKLFIIALCSPPSRSSIELSGPIDFILFVRYRCIGLYTKSPLQFGSYSLPLASLSTWFSPSKALLCACRA